jgi:pyruvyltransferase
MRTLLRAIRTPLVKAGERLATMARREDPNSVFWSVYYPPNFGDLVGPYLYQRLTGENAIFRVPDGLSRRSVYVTAGSIMTLVEGNAIVWGSGIMSRSATFPAPWRTLAVRGPRTRDRFRELGYPCPDVFGDPAILLPRVYQPPRRDLTHQVGVIPHYHDFSEVRGWFAHDPTIKVIDVTHPVDQVIDQITSCARTASSSLHGLIVSNAYDVPSAWVRFSDRLGGDGIKFLDYYASGGVETVAPSVITAHVSAADLEKMVNQAPQPDLSPLLQPLMDACPFPRNSHGSFPGALDEPR